MSFCHYNIHCVYHNEEDKAKCYLVDQLLTHFYDTYYHLGQPRIYNEYILEFCFSQHFRLNYQPPNIKLNTLELEVNMKKFR